MQILNNIRYSRVFSSLFRRPFRIVSNALTFLNRQIQTKIKINKGTVHYFGYELCFPAHVGKGILSRLYWKGEAGFEAETGRILITFLKSATLFLDVGSNYGFYSVLAKKVNPRLTAIAFEPLESNIRQNDLFRVANKVDYALIKKGVTNEAGERKFYVPYTDDRHKEITTASFRNDFFFNAKKKHREVEVACTTLDEVYHTIVPRNAAQDTCVKIDVEGFEFEVLAGASDLLKEAKPIVVCEVDYNSSNPARVFELMERNGFMIFHIQPWGLIRIDKGDYTLKFRKGRNFLFVPEGKLKLTERNFIPFAEVVDFIGFSEPVAVSPHQ